MDLRLPLSKVLSLRNKKASVVGKNIFIHFFLILSQTPMQIKINFVFHCFALSVVCEKLYNQRQMVSPQRC
jgi:hypothetical protein